MLVLIWGLGLYRIARGIVVPQPGIEPGPLAGKVESLTTGLPWNYLLYWFEYQDKKEKMKIYTHLEKCCWSFLFFFFLALPVAAFRRALKAFIKTNRLFLCPLSGLHHQDKVGTTFFALTLDPLTLPPAVQCFHLSQSKMELREVIIQRLLWNW